MFMFKHLLQHVSKKKKSRLQKRGEKKQNRGLLYVTNVWSSEITDPEGR